VNGESNNQSFRCNPIAFPRTNTYQIITTNGVTAKTYAYDLNGNLTIEASSGATNTYEWDAANRLLAVNRGTNRWEFLYDGLNRRLGIVEKQNGQTNTQRFLWCELDLSQERTSNGASVVAQYFPQGEQLSTNLFYTKDHLGSVCEVLDSAMQVRSRYAYDPYGKQSENQVVTHPIDTAWGYAGLYHHSGTTLNLALHRAYDASIARWLGRDPLGEVSALNLYAYVSGDPLGFTDPLGLSAMSVIGCGLKGFAHGVLAAGTIALVGGFVVGAAPALAGIVTGALILGAGLGVAATIFSIAGNPSPENIAYNAGGIIGAGAFAARAGLAIPAALTPPGAKPPAPPSIRNEMTMRWKDPANPNSWVAGLVDYGKNFNRANATAPTGYSAPASLAFAAPLPTHAIPNPGCN
jgi:RHS repeat-associated protein